MNLTPPGINWDVQVIPRDRRPISLETIQRNGVFAMEKRSEGAVMRNHRAFTLTLLIFSWMLFTVNSVYARIYSITDSGIPSGLISPSGAGESAYGIDYYGHFVGLAYDQTGYKADAFLYSAGTTTIPRTLGGANSRGYRINNSGQVVGQADTPAGQHHAFLYKGGKMIDLGTLGGANSSAHDINDSGQIVGSADTSSGQSHAFLYSSGKMIDLGTLGGGYNAAYGTNNSGLIAGFSRDYAFPATEILALYARKDSQLRLFPGPTRHHSMT
jgi:probable HAF family extracellular repeat protein